MKRTVAMLLCLLLTASLLLLTACGDQTELQDGYYTAQAAEFSHGWKEYITILVKGGDIISVEYNAENASGFIKSWDNAYMQTMLHAQGTYPNEYTRGYANQLLERQGGHRRHHRGDLLPHVVPDTGPGCAGTGPERGSQHRHREYSPLGRVPKVGVLGFFARRE